MSKATKRALALLVSFATLAALGLGASGTASAEPRRATADTATVTGTATDGSEFAGTFDVQRFAASNGKLNAVGTLTGSLTDATGATSPVATTASLPVNLAAADGSCQILDLVLGPLDLDLLGLVVHLDTVHLNITAQSGPGKLLGNLLCAVAGLLDGPTGVAAIVNQIAALLNRVLGLL